MNECVYIYNMIQLFENKITVKSQVKGHFRN